MASRSTAVLGLAAVVLGAAAEGANGTLEERRQPRLRAASPPDWCRWVPEVFQSAPCRGSGPGCTCSDLCRLAPPISWQENPGCCGCGGDGSRPSPAPGSRPAWCSKVPPDQRATVPPCAYSEAEALGFAYLSTAAYCGRSVGSWDCGVACEGAPGVRDVRLTDSASLGTHAFVGRLEGQCVVAFRGTDDLNGWAQNLANFELVELRGCAYKGEACRVGRGFLEDYDALAGGVRDGLAAIGCGAAAPLALTGHSLGGALASIALVALKPLGYNVTKAYTFGSPRVGDRAFAGAFEEAATGAPAYRITRADDPFVQMPDRPSYQHAGTEVHYEGDTSQGYRVCDGSGEGAACSAQRSPAEVAGLLAECLTPDQCGHLRYLQPRKRGLMSGRSCRSAAFFP